MIIKIKQGYIRFKRIGKPKHKLYELERIEIYPKYQRKGFGRILFSLMLEKIKFRKLFCTTHASNKKAQAFYEDRGMKPEAVLPNHYYDGKPEIVYSITK